jgi:hypothetical protein
MDSRKKVHSRAFRICFVGVTCARFDPDIEGNNYAC